MNVIEQVLKQLRENRMLISESLSTKEVLEFDPAHPVLEFIDDEGIAWHLHDIDEDIARWES